MQEDFAVKIREALAARPASDSLRKRPTWVGIAAGGLGLIALLGVGLAPRPHSSRAMAEVAPDRRPVVEVVAAVREQASSELALPGTMLPLQETPIYARTDGYVKRWLVDMGEAVRAGQLLAEIEAPEVDRELKQAEANTGQAEANLRLAQSSAQRWQALREDKMVSQQAVDERVGAWEARKADLAAAEANVQRLQELRSFQRVHAPFDGTITARNVEVGQLISAGSGNASAWLYRLSKTGTLRVYVNVPQTHARLVHPGMPADVLLREYPGKPYPGTVLRSAGALDPQSKTLLTEVQVPNDRGELLAGMYAQVRLKLDQTEPAIVLPANTLILRADGPQVAAVEGGTVRMRKVVLGRDFGQRIEVVSGLAEGELVVTNPADTVREGVQVNVAAPAADKRKGAASASAARNS